MDKWCPAGRSIRSEKTESLTIDLFLMIHVIIPCHSHAEACHWRRIYSDPQIVQRNPLSTHQQCSLYFFHNKQLISYRYSAVGHQRGDFILVISQGGDWYNVWQGVSFFFFLTTHADFGKSTSALFFSPLLEVLGYLCFGREIWPVADRSVIENCCRPNNQVFVVMWSWGTRGLLQK